MAISPEQTKTFKFKIKKKIHHSHQISHQKSLDNSHQISHGFVPGLQRNCMNFKTQHNPFQEFYEQFTFQNQKLFGQQIAHSFLDLQLLNVLAIAPTQSGKTGSMLSSIYYCLQNQLLYVPPENIFIITAHSSREWLQQTRQRFPPFMANQIFHRNTLPKFQKRMQDLNNAIIIVDECHIASKHNQTLHKLYKYLNFYNFKHLYNSNIKLIHFTATPELLETSFQTHWKDAFTSIHMNVPNQYKSLDYFIQHNQIFPMKNLYDFDFNSFSFKDEIIRNIQEIIPHIYNFKLPKFHIIRTPRSHKHFITIHNFKFALKHLQNTFNFKFLSELFIQDFDTFTSKTPSTHTFIFIKDKFRCAKTFNHQHIGILYERCVSKTNYSTILQGLLGRATGFHNHKHIIFSQSYNSHNYKIHNNFAFY